MKLILNINTEHAQDYSCPRATFALPRQGGLAGVVQQVTRLLQQTHVNSYRHQSARRGKVDPGVSKLPWDHVNRP